MNAVSVVDHAASLDALCVRVRAAERVGLDTEFHAERSYSPRLMVVQLAFEDGCAIVDPLAVPELGTLVDALGDTIVVGHALSADLKILAARYDVVPTRVFDTQIAAAFLGFGMQISLADLVSRLRGVRLSKSQTVSNWSARPFSQRQLEYLVDDVAYLLPMHDTLRAQLEERGRTQWALDECAELTDADRYRSEEGRAYLRIPGAARMNRRELGILKELVMLRDRVARERDLPVRYVMPDDVVAGLAAIKPKHLDDLVQLRRLDAGTKRQLGVAIVQAVAAGLALDEECLPERPRRPLGPSRDTLASLLGVAIGEIAREADLPASLLVPRSVLERVARELPADRERLERTLALRPWRLELVLEPLWRLLSGKETLRVEGYAEGDPKIRLSHESASG